MSADPRGRLDIRRVATNLILLSTASIAYLGYRFGNSNHSIQIPLLKHYADPSLYQGDLLLTSFDGYVSFFFPVLASLYRLVPDLQLLYFVLFVACQAAALAAMWALACEALPGSTAAGYWACLLFLANPTSLAGESALSLRLTHGNLAVASLLWSCWLALRGRGIAAMAVAGLSFNIHALYAAYAGTILAAMLWAHDWRGRLWGAAAYVAAAAPGLLWLLTSVEPLPEADRAVWLAILRERSGLHTFANSQPVSLYAGYAVFVALGALAAWRTPPGPYRRLVSASLVAVAALCALGFLFAEIHPWPLVLRAQPVRSTKWLTYVLLPCLARHIVLAPGRGPLAMLAAATWAAGLLLQAPVLLACGLGLEAVCLGRRANRSTQLGLTGVLGLAAWASLAAAPRDILTTLTGDLQAIAQPTFMACLALLTVVRLAAGRRWEAASIAVAAAAAAVWLLPTLCADSRRAVSEDSWYQLQAWTRAHTSASAIILTPPEREGFRVFSERVIVVEEKDGTQQFFDAAFGFAWHRRLQEINTLTKRYRRLSPVVVEHIRNRYAITHVVVPPRTRCSLPRLFANAAGSVHSAIPAATRPVEGKRRRAANARRAPTAAQAP